MTPSKTGRSLGKSEDDISYSDPSSSSYAKRFAKRKAQEHRAQIARLSKQIKFEQDLAD